VSVSNELHCSLAEVPKDGSKRLQPLDVKYHVVGAEGEAIADDLGLLAVDRHVQVVAAPQAREPIPIGDGQAQTGQAAECDACTRSRIRVDEIMRVVGVEQGGEVHSIDDDENLHCVPGMRLNAD
jgi:hypothetical protein